MCTAIAANADDFYFGRTLDYEFTYGETVTLTPRNYVFDFLSGERVSKHYAILGMAHVRNNYPLYYDAFNEKGLCMAGLNFVGNAYYNQKSKEKINVAQYEFIPYILCQCKNVEEAVKLIDKINIVGEEIFSMPIAELHFIIADKDDCITVESTREGVKIYENKVGVLTNNPPFNEQISRLSDFMYLSAEKPKNIFSKNIELLPYSRGMGALGLPGDYSSASRFVRIAFLKENSVFEGMEEQKVGQFFHIMDSVNVSKGSVIENGKYEITVYTSCCNATQGIYYYTTYNNRQITGVSIYNDEIDSNELKKAQLADEQKINVIKEPWQK